MDDEKARRIHQPKTAEQRCDIKAALGGSPFPAAGPEKTSGKAEYAAGCFADASRGFETTKRGGEHTMKKGFTGFFLGLLLLCAASCALADVAIDEAHFPDERFRNYVHAHFDANFDWVLTTAEAAKADQVDLGYESDPKYTDLTGLEYLPALRYLRFKGTRVTQVNLSGNPALQTLICNGSRLTSLDVSHNPALSELSCSNNLLSQLILGRLPLLAALDCGENELTALDVSQCPALHTLFCSKNQLAGLDLGQNAQLRFLSCDFNQLSSLDLSGNPALEQVRCTDNRLTALNLTQNARLTDVTASHNQLSALDVSKCPALQYLNLGSNQLASLDLSRCPALTYLSCSVNQLKELNVSGNPALRELYCDGNQLVCLDVSGNSQLAEGYCTFYGCVREVTGENGRLDLSAFPGFQASRASGWTGGTVQGTVLSLPASGDVTYTYQCGLGFTTEFTLRVTGAPSGVTPGDVTGDGKVTLSDVVRLLKYVSHWDVEINEANSDVTGDGKVTLSDVVRLLKYVSHWDVALGA